MVPQVCHYLKDACYLKDDLIRRGRNANRRHQRNRMAWAKNKAKLEAEIKQMLQRGDGRYSEVATAVTSQDTPIPAQLAKPTEQPAADAVEWGQKLIQEVGKEVQASRFSFWEDLLKAFYRDNPHPDTLALAAARRELETMRENEK